ncbi:MAG TPA: DUF3043 domain-containing protein [Dermatophilaceae bacterium]|nr:DUF3043 domain-containing protein [Dermatophilaceae bacterium]
MLWSKKQAAPTPDDDQHPERPGAKNRPTPKRRDQEAARRQPLVVTDRKAARVAEREQRRAAYAQSREAMIIGDESRMPARDRGPVRRFIRDSVDARFSIGEILLPAMLVALILSMIGTSAQVLWAFTAVFVIVYGLLGAAIFDAWLMWRRIKARLVAKFGADQIPSGSMMYAVMRAFQVRRTRLPRPQVKRGEHPV